FLFISAVLAHETFEAGPRFDERAVGGEVRVAGPAFLARELIDFGKEQPRHFRREHALIIFGEETVIETAFAELAVQEPQPKQIVGELLAKAPLAAHAVER